MQAAQRAWTRQPRWLHRTKIAANAPRLPARPPVFIASRRCPGTGHVARRVVPQIKRGTTAWDGFRNVSDPLQDPPCSPAETASRPIQPPLKGETYDNRKEVDDRGDHCPHHDCVLSPRLREPHHSLHPRVLAASSGASSAAPAAALDLRAWLVSR